MAIRRLNAYPEGQDGTVTDDPNHDIESCDALPHLDNSGDRVLVGRINRHTRIIATAIVVVLAAGASSALARNGAPNDSTVTAAMPDAVAVPGTVPPTTTLPLSTTTTQPRFLVLTEWTVDFTRETGPMYVAMSQMSSARSQTAMSIYCLDLADGIARAMRIRAAPDLTVDRDIREGLNLLDRGATACIGGNWASATSYLRQGTDTLKRGTDRMLALMSSAPVS